MIDQVAEKQALLKRANSEGSLSNEQAFRNSIAKFQDGVREHSPSVIDISTSAEKRFTADLANLEALLTETQDPEIRRICVAVIRSLEFLARTKGNS